MGNTSSNVTSAFIKFVETDYEIVFRTFLRVTEDEHMAADLAQEVFLKLSQRLETLENPVVLKAYCKRVVATTISNHYKSNKNILPWIDLEGQEISSHDQNPVVLAGHSERSANLKKAMLELPSKYRMVLDLRYFKGMSYQEMAEVLQLSLNSVGTYLTRARKLLHDRLR